MNGDFRTDLEPIVVRAEGAILDIVRQVVPIARLVELPAEGASWRQMYLKQRPDALAPSA